MSPDTAVRQPMRIAVVGVGAVGGVFGARLAHAGHEVIFIARGATLAALQRDGLFVESIDGDVVLPSVHATDRPETVGPVDVVLVGVKATQVAALAPSLRPLLGQHTAVIPLQNGVEASAQLALALGNDVVLEGLCQVIAQQTAPGRIRHVAVTPVLEFGPRSVMPMHALARKQIEPLAQALREAGLKAITPGQMDIPLWTKFLFIEPYGTVGAVTRAPIGVMRSVPETRALLDRCVHEVLAVAHAVGVALPGDAVAKTWARYDGLPAESTASMQRDLMAGRPSEFEAQTGAVIRLAGAHQVPVPAHDILFAALRPTASAGST